MIEPRMEEIFALANKEVKKNHFAELLGGGVVLTGGTSLMPGVVELAEQVFEMPVRLGVPAGARWPGRQRRRPALLDRRGARAARGAQEVAETNGHRDRAIAPGRRSGRDLRQWFMNLLYH